MCVSVYRGCTPLADDLPGGLFFFSSSFGRDGRTSAISSLHKGGRNRSPDGREASEKDTRTDRSRPPFTMGPCLCVRGRPIAAHACTRTHAAPPPRKEKRHIGKGGRVLPSAPLRHIHDPTGKIKEFAKGPKTPPPRWGEGGRPTQPSRSEGVGTPTWQGHSACGDRRVDRIQRATCSTASTAAPSPSAAMAASA